MISSGMEKSGTYECDICIIGGGVAGITLANELKESGLSVILVDSGGEQYDQTTQELYEANQIDFPFPNTAYSRLRFLGGSSNHWQNNTSPLSPLDFEQRDGIPNSGWPVSYSEIASYYDRAAIYCGVDEDGYSLDHWLKTSKMKDIVAESSVIETRIAKVARLPVRFFTKYGKALKESASVEVITFANLINVHYDETSRKLNLADFKTLQGNTFSIASGKYTMCLGGIENARMLLHFNAKYNNKLGNQGKAVGAFLMEHPTPRAAHLIAPRTSALDLYFGYRQAQKSVGGFLSLRDEVVKENNTINLRMPFIPRSNYILSDGISSSHIFADSLANFELPENASTHAWNILSDIDMVIESISRKVFDKKLFDHANDIGGFEIPMMMEQTPDRQNKVILSNKADILGIPKIDVRYKVTEVDKERLWRSLDICAREIAALGFGRLRLLKNRSLRLWRDQLGFSQHHIGTTRMGSMPDDGVVDANLRVFGTENFFIGGSSVFPTGGCVPPTLTIAALSVRLAEHLTKRDKNYES